MSLSVPTMAAIRYGYGIRPGEPPARGADDLLAQVQAGRTAAPLFPPEGIESRRKRIAEQRAWLDAYRKAVQNGTADRERRKRFQQDRLKTFQTDAVARIVGATMSPLGFNERLAGFWTNHFSVNAAKGLALWLMASLMEAEAIRPNMSGRFADLLQAVTLHPAMLIYLDQIRSVGPNSRAGKRNDRGLNENLARELMELHTLGVDGGYTQDDVRSAALLLTGLGIKVPEQTTQFRPRRAEPGPFEILGKSYGKRRRSMADCEALLDDLAANPHTARHISRKLATHFIDDAPPDDMVDAMVAAWQASDGTLIEVYRAMLEHPRAWTEEGRKIKTPFEFIVSGLRALDVDDETLTAMIAVRGVDEAPSGPASPAGDEMAGVDEDKATGEAAAVAGAPASGTGVMAKDNPAGTAAEKPDRQARRLTAQALAQMGQAAWRPPSPKGFADDAAAWLTASQLTARIEWARKAVTVFGKDDDPREFLRKVLADAARDDTIQVVSQAPSKAYGMTLVLASPEFNRR
ncbi:DUF1800 domain-containing protein [Ferirhizobium litorale]|nr:DUF1800 domain-containing protein [Fererhizobium litorale]